MDDIDYILWFTSMIWTLYHNICRMRRSGSSSNPPSPTRKTRRPSAARFSAFWALVFLRFGIWKVDPKGGTYQSLKPSKDTIRTQVQSMGYGVASYSNNFVAASRYRKNRRNAVFAASYCGRICSGKKSSIHFFADFGCAVDVDSYPG